MKANVTETKYGLYIELTPDTITEVAQLTRFAHNAKAEKPQIVFRFGTDKPSLDISMRKLHTDKQTNSIMPGLK